MSGIRALLQTGQHSCHDSSGECIPCQNSGQDAEYRSGLAWPEPRFHTQDDVVVDELTGLIWTLDANPAEFPLDWYQALDFIAELNRSRHLGFDDWRLPNRRELRSLISHQTRRPALPEHYPFQNLFNHWYWSSTSSAGYPNHAWYVNMDGGRMFYGGKDQAFMVWPVRGHAGSVIPVTGQQNCYDESGRVIPCLNTGQDGEHQTGLSWPQPRYTHTANGVIDQLTGLLWYKQAAIHEQGVNWEQALMTIKQLNTDTGVQWRLPNINELESLVDAGQHNPALPLSHPFDEVKDIYWSSTTSLYEADWAWALYLDKGAIGVGQKSFARFHVWPVSSVI